MHILCMCVNTFFCVYIHIYNMYIIYTQYLAIQIYVVKLGSLLEYQMLFCGFLALLTINYFKCIITAEVQFKS